MVEINKASYYQLKYHFRGKRVHMRYLFDELIKKLVKRINFEYKIGKTYIGLIHTVVFAALRIQTEKIIVEFVIRKRIKSPRIHKVIQASNDRWAYFVDVKESRDIDRELVDWVVGSWE